MDTEKKKIKQLVVRSYADVAKGNLSFLAPSSCCAPEADSVSLLEAGRRLGYSDEELKIGLGEANLGLGCGNPRAIADLKEGETVLDLGSGAGFDAILCSMKVGKTGRVIGIDMTPDMVMKAQENAAKLNAGNVEFRHGEIEHLPLADNSVDVIISNCVINLSTDKQAVFRDSFRVLKPGGRLAISDILKRAEFSQEILSHEHAYSGWITGSVPVEELMDILTGVGFRDIVITNKQNSDEVIRSWKFGEGVEKMVVSAYIRAIKPSS